MSTEGESIKWLEKDFYILREVGCPKEEMKTVIKQIKKIEVQEKEHLKNLSEEEQKSRILNIYFKSEI